MDGDTHEDRNGASAKRVVIVGGDAAGLKTAARLKRIDPSYDVTVFERSDVLSYAACGLPYYLSGDIDSFQALVETPWGEVKNADYFERSKGIQVRVEHEVISIDREQKQVKVRRKGSDSSRTFAYDICVLATGASPVVLDLPGCDGAGVCCFTRPEDAKEMRSALERNEIGRVAIVGGGYIGLELCEAFGALWGVETVLVEMEDQVLKMNLDRELAWLVERHLEEQGVKLHLGRRLERVRHTDSELIVLLDDGREEEVDRVVMTAGVRPNVRLAFETGLEIGPHGGIRIDCNGRTNDPAIYAAGDCAEIPDGAGTRLLPLGSIANRMGRVVANTIAGVEEPGLPRCHGAGVVKVFDLNVGSVGVNARRARKRGLEIEEYWATFPVEAHYYPESNDVLMKLVREKNGPLLGLQAIGKGEVVRWIDAFSQVLDLTGGDPKALGRFEHAYAPPFANAMDPFHHFASMIEQGPELHVAPQVFREGGEVGWTWIDLLDPSEREHLTLPEVRGQIQKLSLAELRAQVDTLPRENVIAFCAKGPRAYDAVRFLRHHGIGARYLAGGVKFLG